MSERAGVTGFLVAALLACLAALMPFVPQERLIHRYILTFDISQSMNVMDVSDEGQVVSRLKLAKSAAGKLLRELPCGSSLGLNVFAGARTILLLKPLEVCEHFAGLLASLQSIDGRMRFDNASSIGKGLHQSLRAAHESGEQSSVIFFSDGHEAPPLREGQQGLPRSEKLGIKGVLVGLGGEIPVRIPKTDLEGRQIGYWQASDVEELSKRHESHLQLLAQLSGFSYLGLDDASMIVSDIEALGLAVKKEVPTDLRWLPASLALAVLCLQFLPRRRVWVGS